MAVSAGAAAFALANVPTVDEGKVNSYGDGEDRFYLPGDAEVKRFEDVRSRFYVAAGIFGVAWAIAAIDAFLLGGERPMSLELSQSPSVVAPTSPPRWDLAFRIRR